MKNRNNHTNSALTFDYIKEKYGGILIPRPRVEIKLSNGNKSFKTAMLVDSGADTSLLPMEIAQILELDLNSGDRIESSSASGKFTTVRKEVNAELVKGTKTIKLGIMPVLISLRDSHENISNSHALLGRSLFFRKFDITFRENSFKLILRKPRKYIEPLQLSTFMQFGSIELKNKNNF